MMFGAHMYPVRKSKLLHKGGETETNGGGLKFSYSAAVLRQRS